MGMHNPLRAMLCNWVMPSMANAAAPERAVTQDLPVLQSGQRTLDPCSYRAMDGALCLLPKTKRLWPGLCGAG